MISASRLLRPVMVLGLLDAVGWLLCAPTVAKAATAVRDEPVALATWPLDQVVVTAAAIGCLVLLATVTMCVLVALADLAVGSRSRLLHGAADKVTPQAVRRLVMALCGLGVAGSALAGPAAVAADTTGAAHCPPQCALRVDGLPLPELPTAQATTTHSPASLITVHPGDSLWQISVGLLPPDAGPARVADLVTRLYAANRAVVGPDPDLILPGMHLVVPKGQP